MGDTTQPGEESVQQFKVRVMWHDLYEGDEPLVNTFKSDRAIQADRDAQAEKRQKRMEYVFAGATLLFSAIELIHLFHH